MSNITMVNPHAAEYLVDWSVWVLRETDNDYKPPRKHILRDVPATEGPLQLAERIAKQLGWTYGSVLIGGCKVIAMYEKIDA